MSDDTPASVKITLECPLCEQKLSVKAEPELVNQVVRNLFCTCADREESYEHYYYGYARGAKHLPCCCDDQHH